VGSSRTKIASDANISRLGAVYMPLLSHSVSS
jgi:hypothetical protein